MSTKKNTRILRAILLLLIFLTTVLLPNQALITVSAAPTSNGIDLPADSVDKNAQAHILESYGSLPMSFESNQGQSAAPVKFLAKGNGYNIFLTEDETVIKLMTPERADSAKENKILDEKIDNLSPENLPVTSVKKDVSSKKNMSSQEGVLRMKLVGANRPSQIRGVDQLEFKSNYFTGKDPSAWHTGVSNFAKVQYEKVYDGVDMIFYGKQQQLEYDFQVAAGVNPSKIVLALEGAQRLRLDSKGDLVMTVGGKEIRQKKPVAFQDINGEKKNVAVHYVRKGKNRVGFQVGRYDKSKPLTIDPVLVYSTFLGGRESETGYAIDVDANGCAYVTGRTTSQDFPLVNPLFPSSSGFRAIFISKLNPTGTGLLYSSTIKNINSTDAVAAIKVNSFGQAYITGYISSENFPTANAIQPLLAGQSDAFIMKLNQTGNALVYSTYLGGMYGEQAKGLAIDSNDNAIIAGATGSPDFPLANPLQPAINNVTDAFVTKLNPAGSAFVYSTYLGGSTTDQANDIAVDAAGNAYIVGTTQSGDFPLMNPVQNRLADQTLIKSTNGGASWTPLTNGLPAAISVYDIEADPTNSATLYLAGYLDDGYKSTNGGTNWTALHLPRTPNSTFNEIEIAPSNPSTVYAGLFPDGVARSTDGGASWDTRNGIFIYKNTLGVSPTTSTHVYLTNFIYGAFESTEGGENFDDLGMPNPGSRAECIAMLPGSPDAFYVATFYNGIYKYTSSGAGYPWSFVSNRNYTTLLVIDPSNPNTLYTISALEGLAKSTNGGTTWVNLNAPPNDLGTITTIAVDPGNSSIVYIGGSGGYVYKSVNGGVSWNKLFENPISGGIQKIEIDPISPGTVYVGGAVGGDAFVTKINPTGSVLMFSTYFGGKGNDRPTAIAVDPAGNPVIAGSTGSRDLPTTSLQQSYQGSGDGFVTKFDIANHRIMYSTYIGGNAGDSVNDMAVDTSGNVTLVGYTYSTNFPTTPDAIPLPDSACQSPTCLHTFVTKLNANGSAYLYSTYLGGSSTDVGNAIAVDSVNNVYVTGYAFSADFPTTPNAYDRQLTGQQSPDAFITKIAPGTPFFTCLKDDTNGNILRINTAVGEFEFANCRKGWVVKGPLTTTVRGCKTELTSGGRTGLQLSAVMNTCTKQGNATIVVDGKSYTIADPSITGNECSCSTP